MFTHRILVERNGASEYRTLSTQAKVKVVPTSEAKVVRFSMKDLITPTWTVQLQDAHPEIAADAVLSVHARSYQDDGHVFRGDIFHGQTEALVAGSMLAGFNAVMRATLRGALTLAGGRRLRHA